MAPDVLEIRLDRPPGTDFVPGQFMRFQVAGAARDYTMISAPDAATLDFCVALVDRGRFSSRIRQARLGDGFQMSGPYGYFTYQGPTNPAVFVATGTGLAPFIAYCRSGVRDGLLLHGVPSAQQLIYRDYLRTAIRRYIPCVSRLSDTRAGDADVWAGRVTRYLDEMLPRGTYDFYLCGRRSMIRDATVVVDNRFPGSRLFIEPYD